MAPSTDHSRVVGFQQDEGNARKSEDRHGVSQPEAEQVFANEPLLIVPDSQHGQSEQRYNALGRTELGRLFHVTFTLRDNDTTIRVISAPYMSRRERDQYAQET